MNTIDTNFLESIGIGRPENPEGPRNRSGDDLGVNDFLSLMLAQIKNQDPFEPASSGEFISQLAEFGTVSGIDKLQQSFAELSSSTYSNQALQSAALIGRDVEVPTSRFKYNPGQSINGSFELPISSSQVRLQVLDSSGSLVKTIDLGAQQSGMNRFSWNGTNTEGSPVVAGEYTVVAEALIDGTMQGLNTFMSQSVVSVSLAGVNGGIELELASGETVPFGSVREIR